MIGRLGDDDFGARFLDRSPPTASTRRGVTVDPDEGTGVGAPARGGRRRELDRDRPARQPRDHRGRRGRRGRDHRARPRCCSCSSSSRSTSSRRPPRSPTRRAPRSCSTPRRRRSTASTRFAGLVDVLVPNEVEAAALSGSAGDPVGRGRRRCATSIGGDGGRHGRRARASGRRRRATRAARPRTPSTPSTPSAPATPSAVPSAPASPRARRSATPPATPTPPPPSPSPKPGAEPSMPSAAEIEALLQAEPYVCGEVVTAAFTLRRCGGSGRRPRRGCG